MPDKIRPGQTRLYRLFGSLITRLNNYNPIACLEHGGSWCNAFVKSMKQRNRKYGMSGIRCVRFGCWFVRRDTLFVREAMHTKRSYEDVIQETWEHIGRWRGVEVRSNWWVEPHITRRPVTGVPTFRRPTIRGVNPHPSVFSAVGAAPGLLQLVPCDLLRGCGTHRR